MISRYFLVLFSISFATLSLNCMQPDNINSAHIQKLAALMIGITKVNVTVVTTLLSDKSFSLDVYYAPEAQSIQKEYRRNPLDYAMMLAMMTTQTYDHYSIVNLLAHAAHKTSPLTHIRSQALHRVVWTGNIKALQALCTKNEHGALELLLPLETEDGEGRTVLQALNKAQCQIMIQEFKKVTPIPESPSLQESFSKMVDAMFAR